MYIQKQEFRPGFNDYLRSDAGVGREINMDVQLLILERDDTIRIEEPEKETAILLFEGTADAALDGRMVHPYLRRNAGRPSGKRALRTLYSENRE